uniref:Cyclic nucleotide-binding domain-containing protein n=1 Tax=Chromera velia CCMP2878 TaxID=1169474 RepID=A0A0G4F2L1_9ALVE|eukprot:Cvel_2643.t1-p1 / transcript=Cvel_2643.t1 / gene=Cvel_2643 / organism=Chromera_velia_CCMP2878 / gene_product=hypothetical protein / transcript_product=hypothetical protein / location=Cvel_scaffold105:2339-15321(-) / protein_length=2197 / sequence_SO=supercontig / SO=protein_coding / is_pseudo=false
MKTKGPLGVKKQRGRVEIAEEAIRAKEKEKENEKEREQAADTVHLLKFFSQNVKESVKKNEPPPLPFQNSDPSPSADSFWRLGTSRLTKVSLSLRALTRGDSNNFSRAFSPRNASDGLVDLVRALKGAPLFAGVPPAVLRKCARMMTAVAFRPGDLVCETNEACDCLGVLVEGSVCLESETQEDGDESEEEEEEDEEGDGDYRKTSGGEEEKRRIVHRFAVLWEDSLLGTSLHNHQQKGTAESMTVVRVVHAEIVRGLIREDAEAENAFAANVRQARAAAAAAAAKSKKRRQRETEGKSSQAAQASLRAARILLEEREQMERGEHEEEEEGENTANPAEKEAKREEGKEKEGEDSRSQDLVLWLRGHAGLPNPPTSGPEALYSFQGSFISWTLPPMENLSVRAHCSDDNAWEQPDGAARQQRRAAPLLVDPTGSALPALAFKRTRPKGLRGRRVNTILLPLSKCAVNHAGQPRAWTERRREMVDVALGASNKLGLGATHLWRVRRRTEGGGVPSRFETAKDILEKRKGALLEENSRGRRGEKESEEGKGKGRGAVGVGSGSTVRRAEGRWPTFHTGTVLATPDWPMTVIAPSGSSKISAGPLALRGMVKQLVADSGWGVRGGDGRRGGGTAGGGSHGRGDADDADDRGAMARGGMRDKGFSLPLSAAASGCHTGAGEEEDGQKVSDHGTHSPSDAALPTLYDVLVVPNGNERATAALRTFEAPGCPSRVVLSTEGVGSGRGREGPKSRIVTGTKGGGRGGSPKRREASPSQIRGEREKEEEAAMLQSQFGVQPASLYRRTLLTSEEVPSSDLSRTAAGAGGTLKGTATIKGDPSLLSRLNAKAISVAYEEYQQRMREERERKRAETKERNRQRRIERERKAAEEAQRAAEEEAAAAAEAAAREEAERQATLLTEADVDASRGVDDSGEGTGLSSGPTMFDIFANPSEKIKQKSKPPAQIDPSGPSMFDFFTQPKEKKMEEAQKADEGPSMFDFFSKPEEKEKEKAKKAADGEGEGPSMFDFFAKPEEKSEKGEKTKEPLNPTAGEKAPEGPSVFDFFSKPEEKEGGKEEEIKQAAAEKEEKEQESTEKESEEETKPSPPQGEEGPTMFDVFQSPSKKEEGEQQEEKKETPDDNPPPEKENDNKDHEEGTGPTEEGEKAEATPEEEEGSKGEQDANGEPADAQPEAAGEPTKEEEAEKEKTENPQDGETKEETGDPPSNPVPLQGEEEESKEEKEGTEGQGAPESGEEEAEGEPEKSEEETAGNHEIEDAEAEEEKPGDNEESKEAAGEDEGAEVVEEAPVQAEKSGAAAKGDQKPRPAAAHDGHLGSVQVSVISQTTANAPQDPETDVNTSVWSIGQVDALGGGRSSMEDRSGGMGAFGSVSVNNNLGRIGEEEGGEDEFTDSELARTVASCSSIGAEQIGNTLPETGASALAYVSQGFVESVLKAGVLERLWRTLDPQGHLLLKKNAQRLQKANPEAKNSTLSQELLSIADIQARTPVLRLALALLCGRLDSLLLAHQRLRLAEARARYLQIDPHHTHRGHKWMVEQAGAQKKTTASEEDTDKATQQQMNATADADVKAWLEKADALLRSRALAASIDVRRDAERIAAAEALRPPTLPSPRPLPHMRPKDPTAPPHRPRDSPPPHRKKFIPLRPAAQRGRDQGGHAVPFRTPKVHGGPVAEQVDPWTVSLRLAPEREIDPASERALALTGEPDGVLELAAAKAAVGDSRMLRRILRRRTRPPPRALTRGPKPAPSPGGVATPSVKVFKPDAADETERPLASPMEVWGALLPSGPEAAQTGLLPPIGGPKRNSAIVTALICPPPPDALREAPPETPKPPPPPQDIFEGTVTSGGADERGSFAGEAGSGGGAVLSRRRSSLVTPVNDTVGHSGQHHSTRRILLPANLTEDARARRRSVVGKCEALPGDDVLVRHHVFANPDKWAHTDEATRGWRPSNEAGHIPEVNLPPRPATVLSDPNQAHQIKEGAGLLAVIKPEGERVSQIRRRSDAGAINAFAFMQATEMDVNMPPPASPPPRRRSQAIDTLAALVPSEQPPTPKTAGGLPLLQPPGGTSNKAPRGSFSLSRSVSPRADVGAGDERPVRGRSSQSQKSHTEKGGAKEKRGAEMETDAEGDAGVVLLGFPEETPSPFSQAAGNAKDSTQSQQPAIELTISVAAQRSFPGLRNARLLMQMAPSQGQ